MTEPSRVRPGGPETDTPALADEPETKEDLVAQWEAEKPPAAGRANNLAAAVVVIGFGVFALLQSLNQGIGSPANPGAGTWPFVISLILIILGIALVAVSGKTKDAERFSSKGWAVLFGLATMIGFGLLIPMTGFEIPGVLLTFAWLKGLGREPWRTSIIASISIVAAFYLVFVLVLRTSIPHLF